MQDSKAANWIPQRREDAENESGCLRRALLNLVLLQAFSRLGFPFEPFLRSLNSPTHSLRLSLIYGEKNFR